MERWTIIRRRVAGLLARYDEIAKQTGNRSAFDSTSGSHAILKEIAEECFGLMVIDDASLPNNVQGCLNREEGTITYQPGLSPQKTVFIIAHEIGHRELDHAPRQIQPGATDVIEDTNEHINDEPQGRALVAQDGVYRAYSERDRWELEANVFAAELLAPTRKIREKISNNPRWT